MLYILSMSSSSLSLKSSGQQAIDYCEVPSIQSIRDHKMVPMHLTVLLSIGLFVHISQAKVCPGCPVKIDPNQQEVNEYLSNKIKSDIPKGLEDEQELQLVQVLYVKKQVVSGILLSYQFIARGLRTNKLYECSLVVVQQAWKGEKTTTEYYCHEIPTNENERLLLGTEILLDITNNDKLEELETFIADEIRKDQGSKYLMKIIKYFKASKQLVKGNLIKATVEIANTNCLLNEPSTSDNCQIQAEDHQICDVDIWLKPWINEKEVTKVQCRHQPKFCAGCVYETNVNSIGIQQCLKRTLSNLNAKSHFSKNISLVKINKVTSQVISGVKYVVDFNANDEGSGKSLTCNAVIILQPWISEEPKLMELKCTPTSN